MVTLVPGEKVEILVWLGKASINEQDMHVCGRRTQAKMTTDSFICVSLRCLLGQSVLGIVFHGMDRSITTLNKEKTNFVGRKLL